MDRIKLILGLIILWWGIEIAYVGCMLFGISFWTKTKPESYNLYLMELVLNLVLIDFWVLSWSYKIKLNQKYRNWISLLFLFVHCYAGIRVFTINNKSEYFKRRVYAYVSWIAWFIMCIYLQVTYINLKLYGKQLTNVIKSSTIDVKGILSYILMR